MFSAPLPAASRAASARSAKGFLEICPGGFGSAAPRRCFSISAVARCSNIRPGKWLEDTRRIEGQICGRSHEAAPATKMVTEIRETELRVRGHSPQTFARLPINEQRWLASDIMR